MLLHSPCATSLDVHVLYADQLNTYDVLLLDVVFTKAAHEAFVASKAVEKNEDAK